MGTILLVEDASFFEKAALRKLAAIGETDVSVARCYKQAQTFLENAETAPALALVDLTLPDARNGEIVDLCRDHGIPTVVFTGRYETHIRHAMREKGILDYVIKDSPSSLDYIGDLIQRFWRNPDIGILLVDDVNVERMKLKQVLQPHRYQVFEARNSAEGLALLKDNPQIKCVLVDYFMPNEDGFSLLKTLRRQYSREQLAILGMSGYDDDENRIRFLKYGASDFLLKSCSAEELLLRVSQNLDIIGRLEDLRETSLRDVLTGLYNRRFLFKDCRDEMDAAEQDGGQYWLAMVDLDAFKAINDTHGHMAGDTVLKKVASELAKVAGPSEYAIRLGGDEFCLVLRARNEAEANSRTEALAQQLKNRKLVIDGNDVAFSVSIGIAPIADGGLEAALGASDTRLYKAKDQGGGLMVAAG